MIRRTFCTPNPCNVDPMKSYNPMIVTGSFFWYNVHLFHEVRRENDKPATSSSEVRNNASKRVTWTLERGRAAGKHVGSSQIYGPLLVIDYFTAPNI